MIGDFLWSSFSPRKKHAYKIFQFHWSWFKHANQQNSSWNFSLGFSVILNSVFTEHFDRKGKFYPQTEYSGKQDAIVLPSD